MSKLRNLELDEAQRRAVDHDGGPLLVLGGPGTGKTTVLESRYLRLASSRELAPHRILFLCTNRAYSMEAKDRLATALPHEAMVEVPVYTWHALGYHLVTRYYPKLGYRETPVLLTAPEQWGFVRELLAGENPVDWPRWGERLRDRGFIDEVADFCLRAEQKLMEDEDLESLIGFRPDWEEVVRFYRRYREALKKQSRLDYAGLISAAVRMLRENDEVKERLRGRFPHVLVDEAEEGSPAQRELLALLDTSHLVVAADPDSGIETFRGAEPDWVLGFEKHFGVHETCFLEKSYRVGLPLLEASSTLIAYNDDSAPHRIKRGSDDPTEFQCLHYTSAAEEVESIARELRRLHLMEDVPWGEMAVLVSQPAYLLDPLERALERWEVPYLPLSSDRPLSAEPSVGSFLDLVRVALREPGWEELLPQVLTTPLGGLDYASRRALERRSWQERTKFSEVVEQAGETEDFRHLRDLALAHQDRADECFWQVYEAAPHYRGLVERAVSDPTDPANAEVDALVAFSHALGRFVERRHGRGSISDYLKEAARADFGGDPWLPSGRMRSDVVSLLSFHAAKGRQWDTVVVAGCLDAWIPKGRRARGLFDPFALGIAEVVEREVEAIADDRRTFYVAATRAKRKAMFTVSPGPSGRGRPSRFLTELAGAPPDEAEAPHLPPLTGSEMRARLRATASDPESLPEEKVASLVALAEMPGVDPSRWYGRWGWTEGAIPLTTPGEFRTSYSRLGVYENCGLQYVLQSVLGLDPATTHSMKFGTWMHALFQAVHDGKINDPATLRAEYHRIFDDGAFPSATIARQYRRDGEKMLERFWREEFTQTNVYTEMKFEFPYENAILRGRIDRIDKVGNVLKLTDYKTSRWAPSRKEAAESLQLAIYILAARLAPSVEAAGGEEEPPLTHLLKEIGGIPKVARLVYPGDTWADGSIKVLSQNDDEADAVLEQLPQLIADVMDERFAPSPEADCNWCAMKPLCPLWPDGREVT